MQLINIHPDRVQIKSDSIEVGDLSIHNVLLLRDETRDISLVSVVTSIARNGEPECFGFDGTPLETESESTIECSVIGSLVDGRFRKSVDAYPSTNVKIQRMTDGLFEEMLGSNKTDLLPLGRYATYDCAALLDGNKLFQRHAAILGNTGSGKSFTVASILEKLHALPSANVVLFDIHGEYSELSYVKTVKIGNDGLPFPLWFLSLRDLYGNLLKVKEESAQLQIAALRKAFYTARSSEKSEELPLCFDLGCIIDLLEQENNAEVFTGEFYKTGDKAGQAKTVKGENHGKLSSMLNLLKDKALDRRYDFMMRPAEQSYLHEFTETLLGIEGGGIKVLDLSDVPSDMVPTIIAVTTKLLYRVQRMQDRARILPLSFLCDEAHVYIPASDFGLGASQRRLLEVFETIAKEGRKFGVSLLVVSQRPSELNRTILAQCSNFIVLKLSNDADKQIIKSILPEGSRGLVDSVNLFRPGDCLVVGDSAEISMKIVIDPPHEAPNSNTLATWSLWSQEATQDVHALTDQLLNA